jgi:molybdopterin molybdotransferase
MLPFTRFESLAQAVAWIERHTRALPPETVALSEAAGRVLADGIAAPLDFPPFDRAAVDGYAVRGLDTVGAGGYGPVSLRLQGAVAAGCERPGSLAPGAAVRIGAGAALPVDADAVVPRSHAEETAGQVDILEAVAPGENVVRRGADIRAGSGVLPVGRRVGPRELAILAASGLGQVAVVRRPRVRLLIAGQGLAVEGGVRGAHEVFEADGLMLATLVERDGGMPVDCRRIPPGRRALAEALREPGADLVLIAGGSGEGWEDCAAEALADAGEVAFHGIALEPARSAGVGRVGEAPVFLLPGDPVACLCAYDCLAGSALRRLAGLGSVPPYSKQRVALARKIASTLGAVDYCRLRLTPEGAEPLAAGANTGLALLAATDGFLLVPEDSEGYPAGAEVAMFLFPN